MNAQELKQLSIKEFTKAAESYDSDHEGIYEMCRDDYPDILAELEFEPFQDLLDCGCGTGPMIYLLAERYPERRYTGLDLTPRMIEVAREKQIPNAEFVVGDCENIPFDAESFDVVICSQSFHHYPHPQDFFNSVFRVLRPGGRLVLRDNTAPAPLVWIANHVEMPLAHLLGHGDVGIFTTKEIEEMCRCAGLVPEKVEQRKGLRLHCVARKPRA